MIILITSVIASVLSVRKWIISPLHDEVLREKQERERSDKEYEERLFELATKMQSLYGYTERIAALEVKMGVFWTMVEKSTADLLHRDDTPNIDHLLEKLPVENLSKGEREELMGYLKEIEVSEDRPRADRVAAIMLRASIEARIKNPYE